ncbi:hypothetical protein [Hymenobacter nivis]|uniref:hypothetical protein n=1 Tax=Hymenobacter nivis TaxID=1850093 RepID=UPI0013A5AA68|nr:hypothetical protein [Hymenobacter nivis]
MKNSSDHYPASASADPANVELINDTPIPVPDAQWVGTVEVFALRLGPPVLLPKGASDETATDAIWGKGENAVHLHRGDKGSHDLAPVGRNLMLVCATPKQTATIFKRFKKLKYRVRSELATFAEIGLSHGSGVGPPRTITVGTFYLNGPAEEHGAKNGKRLFPKADLVGVVDHNPPTK